MALTDSDMIMPVAPSGNFGGNGFGGDWGSWIILFLIFGMFNGGWGGYGGGNALGYDFPWLLNGQNGINANTNAGFQNAALTSQIGDLSTAVNGIAQQINNSNVSNLERSFAAQTAQMQGMNALQSQFADCCCENRLANCQTQNAIQNEGNATRFADANNTRDIITNQTSNTQAILDKLCALEMEGYKRENDNLRQQLNMATLAASQNAQTATIQAGQRALASEVEQYINPTPIPAYQVPNPFCCNNTNYGCGCGM